jgi:hypothetical protein
LINGFQQHFRLARKGVLDLEVMDDMERGMRWVVQQPGYRQWWKQWAGESYSPDFRDYVDGVIREGEAAG